MHLGTKQQQKKIEDSFEKHQCAGKYRVHNVFVTHSEFGNVEVTNSKNDNPQHKMQTVNVDQFVGKVDHQ